MEAASLPFMTDPCHRADDGSATPVPAPADAAASRHPLPTTSPLQPQPQRPHDHAAGGHSHCPAARIITTAIYISDPISLDALLRLKPAPLERAFRRTFCHGSLLFDVLLAITFTLLLQLCSPSRTSAPLLYLAFTLLLLAHLTAPPLAAPPLARLLCLATFLASGLASHAYLRDASVNPLLTAPGPRSPLALLGALLLLQAPVAVCLFPSLSPHPGFLPTLPRHLATLALSLTHLLPPAARALARPATHPATLTLLHRLAGFWALLQSALMGAPIERPPWAAHCPPLALALTAQLFSALALPATLHYFLERHRKRRFVVAHLHRQQSQSPSDPPPPPPAPPAPRPPPHTPNCLFLTDCDSSKLLLYFPGILRDTYATVRLLPPPAAPPPTHPPGLAVLIANHLSFLGQLPCLAAALVLAALAALLAAVVAARLAVALAGDQLVAWQVCQAPLAA